MAPAENCQRPATLTVNQTSLWEIQKKKAEIFRVGKDITTLGGSSYRRLLSMPGLSLTPISGFGGWKGRLGLRPAPARCCWAG